MDSEESAEESTEPLATTRSRRANAGNRMDKILLDEDEFYTSLYGGFNEEEDDLDFDSDDEEVEDDYDVDSDFSIDETDEIAPEFQVVDEEPKKKKGVYKDPKPKGYSTHAGPSSSTPMQPRPRHQSPIKSRSFRDSTRKKTEETIKNIESDTKKKKKKFRNPEAWRQLTQEEMLEEAKLTEEENLKSLEIYQRLESEKLNKLKQVKKTLPLPYSTYTSLTMPVLDKEGEYYSRNFMSFHPDLP